MIRPLLFCALVCGTPVFAQETPAMAPAMAHVIAQGSSIIDNRTDVEIELALSEAVPHRIFLLDDPRRLVVDFAGLEWVGSDATAIDLSESVTDIAFGIFRPGWSRLVLGLSGPFAVETAGMTVGRAATLAITLAPTDAASFASSAGAPPDGVWAQIAENAPSLPAPTPDNGPVTVVIDPGHGGIDPGAIQGGVQEADLMLQLAKELAASLNATGQIRAILTRETDTFISLEGRMSIARAARADLLMSLHADALAADDARGASVYTLDAEGTDQSARRMAERHERGDLLAGLDLRGQGDRVATVLMDLARAETAPQADRFAQAAVAALQEAGARMNSRPRREGPLAVLNAPDFAAVLIEVGFLSNDQDRAVLSTVAGRARVVDGITQAVLAWAEAEAAITPRLRQ